MSPFEGGSYSPLGSWTNDNPYDKVKRKSDIATQIAEIQRAVIDPSDPMGPSKRIYGEFNSYSGVDIIAYIRVPPAPGTPLTEAETTLGVLGTLQTLSYSIHREVVPVRALGKVRAHAYTRGPRTIAGTMVWAVFDQYVLAMALRNTYGQDMDATTILVDQLPPFDIVITFNNEYGDVSRMGIYGIRMVNEGSTFSIDDMLTEQINTYVATDLDLMHKGPSFLDKRTGETIKTAGSLAVEEAKKRLAAYRSPFL